MNAAVWRGSAGAGTLSRWQTHLLLLGGLLLVLGATWTRDVAGIVAVWSRTGAFHHCFVIPPILAALVWQRRAALALLTPERSVAGAGVVAAGALLLLMGEAGPVALLRQAGVVIAAIGLVIATLGRPVARALAFPLGFALFLVPAGSEAEPWLQAVTAKVAVALLHLAGTPAALEGVFITTPAGLFRVAEACSGTGFLLAMAAYAALVCLLCFRSPLRRAAFCAVAMTAALLGNGVRAFAIMQVAAMTSMRNPVVTDHILYGWLLFAAILVGLMCGAARWFDGEAPPPDARAIQGVARGERPLGPFAALMVALLVLPRLWLGVGAAEVPLSPPPMPPAVAGWPLARGLAPADWHPHFTGATWIGQWRYRGPAGRIADLAIVIFDRQGEGPGAAGFGQGAIAADDEHVAPGGWASAGSAPALSGGRGEWLRRTDGATRYAVTVYRIGNTLTGSRAAAKLAVARARLLGRPGAATAILVSAEARHPAEAMRAVAAFLRAAGPVQEMADRARPIR